MAVLQNDPLSGLSLADYGRKLRAKEISVEAVTKAYLARIEALNGRLKAFLYVDAAGALARAQEIDALIAAGQDLGPLMGVPVGVKDLLAVEGMPTTCGSNVDLTAVVGAEGSFVKGLRDAGCIILGKTNTVEFAYGATGTNAVKGTPWNPVDEKIQRIPGGSSNGSAVAVAAGLCATAVGSDTGGSIRVPASFCGISGLKVSAKVFTNDGVMPLAPSFDTLGFLTRSAKDAALIFHALKSDHAPEKADLSEIKIGQPQEYYFDGLSAEVESSVNSAIAELKAKGVDFIPVSIPEAAERGDIFPVTLGVEFLANMPKGLFDTELSKVDPVVAMRIEGSMKVSGADYARAMKRRAELITLADQKMQGLDAWLVPGTAQTAGAVADLDDAAKGLAMTVAATKNTQPGNMFDQCGVVVQLPVAEGALPVSVQIMGSAGSEAKIVAIAAAMEAVFGAPKLRDMTPFIG